MLFPAILRAAECLSQPLQLLHVAEQGEQTSNQKHVAREWYLKLGPANYEGEPKNSAGEDEEEAAYKLNEHADERISELRQGRTKSMAHPITRLHQTDR